MTQSASELVLMLESKADTLMEEINSQERELRKAKEGGEEAAQIKNNIKDLWKVRMPFRKIRFEVKDILKKLESSVDNYLEQLEEVVGKVVDSE